MDPLDIVKEIQSEVTRCRENRNLMLAKTEENLTEHIKTLEARQCEIKNLILKRLDQTERDQTVEDVAVRTSLDTKVSSSMFRWAIGLLAAGLIGGGLLNYATLRSVQLDNASFRAALELHVTEAIHAHEVQNGYIRDILQRQAANKPADPSIPKDPYLPIPKSMPSNGNGKEK